MSKVNTSMIVENSASSNFRIENLINYYMWKPSRYARAEKTCGLLDVTVASQFEEYYFGKSIKVTRNFTSFFTLDYLYRHSET